MTSLLDIRAIHAGYGGVPVVRDVTLTVEEGEIVALLGANGAGKTTSLLAVSGLLPLMQGSITVMGEAVDSRRPHRVARRGLAHVPEDRGLFFDLTVAENLRLGRRRRSGGTDEEAFEYFPALRRLSNRRAGLLSGGEQQMLALGRAIACHPRLLLVDEMSLGLAPKIVRDVLPALRRVAEERSTGVLLVEQHVELALSVADRVAVLSHGSLVLQDTTAKLENDRALLEASYLGDATLAME